MIEKILKFFFADSSKTKPKKEYVDAFDTNGNKFQIEKNVWANKILPHELKKSWNDSEQLYGLLVMGLKDNLSNYLVNAGERLVQIDSDKDRSITILGIIHLKNGNLDLAENLLSERIKITNKNPGVLLTNLAKVYADKGLHEKSKNTLWQALENDPNQDNGLLWYVSIAREESGEEGMNNALKEIEKFKNSWRASVFIAREYLKNKNIDLAKEKYNKILSIAEDEPDAIMSITGDLGNAGYINEIFEIVFPHFDLQKHGINSGINFVQACIQSRRIELGKEILNDNKKLHRHDYQNYISELELKLK